MINACTSVSTSFAGAPLLAGVVFVLVFVRLCISNPSSARSMENVPQFAGKNRLSPGQNGIVSPWQDNTPCPCMMRMDTNEEESETAVYGACAKITSK